MARIYNKYAFGLPVGIKIAALQPIDIRSVVSDIESLTDNSTWRDGDAILSYKGMVVSVVNAITSELYMCLTDSYPSSFENDWKKLSTPDVEISGSIIEVIEYDGKFYDKADCVEEGGVWIPIDITKFITDPSVNEEGKYLCLEIGEDKVYINSKDLIDLNGYVTEEELNTSINNFYNTSISQYVNITNTLIDGMPADTSIVRMIEEVVSKQGLSPKRFAELVDSSNSNIEVTATDTSIILKNNANIAVGTVSPYDAGLNPKHGDYYVKEEIVTGKPNVEPRRTAYIYNSDDSIWLALDGNVDATNVYFRDGVDRTAAIGVLKETSAGKITNEGKKMNLKELLEYYLVGESFPKGSSTKGSGSFNDFGMKVTGFPNSINSYITVDGYGTLPTSGTLVEVGTKVTITESSGTLACTSTGSRETSVTSNPAKIENLTFGYCTALGDPVESETDPKHYIPGGDVHKNDTSIKGSTVTATATYDCKDNNLNTETTLDINNNLATINKSDSTWKFDTSVVYVSENTNTVKLSLSHDASITRVINAETIPGIDKKYIISNKGHVLEDLSIGAGTATFGGKTSGNISTYTTTQYKLKGVYPIFTNGTSVIATIGETTVTDSAKWYNNIYTDDPSNKLGLIDYFSDGESSRTYNIGWGKTDPETQSIANYKALLFLPFGMDFTIPNIADWDTAANPPVFNGWAGNSMRNREAWESSSTYINVLGEQIKYNVYACHNNAGADLFKVIINKK